MKDSDDAGSTRPISVAELLAKNGSIGAPPVGGKRRRRRGNSDAVTVAELTGEIPIIRDHAPTTTRTPVKVAEPESVDPVEPPTPEPIAAEEPAEAPPEESVEELAEEPVDEVEPVEAPAEEVVEAVEPEPEQVEPAPETELQPEPEPVLEPESEPVLTDEEADYAAHLERRNADPDPLDFAPPTRRPFTTRSTIFAAQGSGAEQMSPDPVIDDDELVDLGPDVDFTEVLDKHASSTDDATAGQDEPSYLRSTAGTLFGGQSVADDLARRGPQPGPEDIDLGSTDAEPELVEKTRDSSDGGGSAFVRGLWVVVQCILAVAFGAGLFIAFDQLWRWNTIVALVLSVLVILGLVVGVRVVRKTEDIGSTLIAVAVGALVTLGPLALLQSH